MIVRITPSSWLAVAAFLLTTALATPTHATDLYWSANGSTQGGAGSWNTTDARWGTISFGPYGDVWDNADSDTAIFGWGGSAGTVTLGVPITVGGLRFNTTGYTIGNSTNTLTFNGTSTVGLYNVAAATITGPVGGTGSLVFSALNPLTSGTISLSPSTVATGSGWSGTTTVNAGATLSLASNGSFAVNALQNSTGISLNGGTISSTRNAGGNAQNQISDSAPITLNGGGTLSFSNGIGGSFTESIGTATVATGQANLLYTNGSSGGGVVTTLAGLSRNASTAAVTFSNANATQTSFRVTGAADTAANEIIGPWSTFGTAVATQTDYAIYSASNGTVAARNIAASAQSTWSTTRADTSNYTLANANGSAANGRLTVSRNINTLRNNTAPGGTISIDTATDIVTMTGSTFVDGDVIVLGTANTPLAAGVPYYVRDSGVGGVGTFRLATTSGGTAVNVTANSGGTLTGGVTLPSGSNLGTYGILNGSVAVLAIGGSGGVITLPTTTTGNLFVTAGSGNIAIDAPIVDNTGTLTLVKGGSAALTLSGNNTFTGGIVNNAGSTTLSGTNTFGSGAVTINGGAVTFSTIASWGGSGRDVTANGTGTLTSTVGGYSGGTLTSNANANAVITGGSLTFSTTTGSGTIIRSASTGSATLNLGNASSFTGTLQARQAVNSAAGTQIQFSSLGDAAGSAIQFVNAVGSNNDSGLSVTVAFNGTTALTFSQRQIQLLDRLAGNWEIRDNTIANNSLDPAHTWTINTDLLYSGGRANSGNQTGRRFVLSGSNTGNNSFNGVISNGSNSNGLSLEKAGNGTWTLSGNNTYTGSTTISGGILRVATLANGNATSSIGASSNAASNLVLNGGGRLQYTGSGSTTDRSFTLSSNSTTSTGIIDSSGTGALVFTSTATPGYGTTNQDRALVLSGSNTDANTLAAALTNNGANALNFRKLSPGRWVLTGTNTYTGTTSVEGGVLQAADGLGLPTASILQLRGGVFQSSGTFSRTVGTAAGNVNWSTSSGGFAAIGGALNVQLNGGTGSVTWNGSSMVSTGQTLIFGSASADSRVDFQNALNLGSSGSGQRTIQVVDNPNATTDIARMSGAITNTVAGWGILKTGNGTLELTGTNTYTGNTTVSEGTLLINGDNSAATGVISVAAGAYLGGTGTIGANLTFAATSLFEIADINDPLAVTGTVTFGSGFGIANLAGIDWNALDLKTPYTLISTSQTFTSGDIANFGVANAASVGGGRSAYFQTGSLQLVVVPEPAAVALAGLGLAGIAYVIRRRGKDSN